jgi:hypothetical protein
VPARNWVPTAGEHLVRAQRGNDSDEVTIVFD